MGDVHRAAGRHLLARARSAALALFDRAEERALTRAVIACARRPSGRLFALAVDATFAHRLGVRAIALVL